MDTAIPLTPVSFESTEKMEKQKLWRRFPFRLLSRDEALSCPYPEQKKEPQLPRPGFGRRLSRRVVPGLPRPGTFRRQNSERREKLKKVEPSVVERRTVSVDRRRAMSARPASPHAVELPQLSAPEIRDIEDGYSTITRRETSPERGVPTSAEKHVLSSSSPPPPDPYQDSEVRTPSEFSREDDIDEEIREELEKRWILNLSMHFRDQSPREKFFLTYAETPQKWKRITISCDYRDAPPDSLERDLQCLQYQRDKSARIYESIRLSLPDIQFYDTVTNLKLETRNDRLHVHVTEDTHEIIQYPTVQAVHHIDCVHYKESELSFECHMSGFVYKVSVIEKHIDANRNADVDRTVWIKKEIPGPDSVDEFLYEINALSELRNSKSVIRFQGLVVDEEGVFVKGLLIAFAEQGAVVDIIYDHKGNLDWPRREKWAQQIVQGLSEIHEAGFVQGDFTLSNIVIDEFDEAKIIDINRRGCPVGWEPPEISRLVESSQRISMYIGVKSDLFQLGMVLWALAKEVDEPERQERPLSLGNASPDIPQYYHNLVDICLSPKPRDRLAASDLLCRFPLTSDISLHPLSQHPRSSSTSSEPLITTSRRWSSSSQQDNRAAYRQDQLSRGDYTYDSYPGSIDIPFDGPGSCIVSRGRQPSKNIGHLSLPERSRHHGPTSANDLDSDLPQIVAISPPRNGEHQWKEIEINGSSFLMQQDLMHLDDDGFGDHDHDRGRQQELEDLRRDLSHVDSGLADMDIAYVGGHEALREIKANEKLEVDRPSEAVKADLGSAIKEEPEPLKL